MINKEQHAFSYNLGLRNTVDQENFTVKINSAEHIYIYMSIIYAWPLPAASSNHRNF